MSFANVCDVNKALRFSTYINPHIYMKAIEMVLQVMLHLIEINNINKENHLEVLQPTITRKDSDLILLCLLTSF